ncbi:hypothetical protein JMUB6875_48090 [Nocardia sp. JMUB6875]
MWTIGPTHSKKPGGSAVNYDIFAHEVAAQNMPWADIVAECHDEPTIGVWKARLATVGRDSTFINFRFGIGTSIIIHWILYLCMIMFP